MARRDKRLGTVVMGYLIEQYIGWGSSSKVYRARHCKTGELAALKIVSKARARLASVQRTIAECQVLSRLKHPNIVKLYSWAESERHVYIAMELARDGDLLDRINGTDRPFPETTVRAWFMQLVDALAYAHAHGFVHKDIKPDNVLFDGDRLILADWGFSHEWTYGRPCTVYCGTRGYWAPEVAANRPFTGPEADCWSLGVTLYAVACNRLPFNPQSPYFDAEVQAGSYIVPGSLSPELTSLITGLINPDPLARLDLKQVKEHAFCRTALPPPRAKQDLDFEVSTADRELALPLLPPISSRKPSPRPAVVMQKIAIGDHQSTPPLPPSDPALAGQHSEIQRASPPPRTDSTCSSRGPPSCADGASPNIFAEADSQDAIVAAEAHARLVQAKRNVEHGGWWPVDLSTPNGALSAHPTQRGNRTFLVRASRALFAPARLFMSVIAAVKT